MIELWQLRQRQSNPLDVKIVMTQERIREFYEHLNGNVFVSFSGGKDSTVLLHLVRSVYPNVKAVFCNTGLEYPEVVQFVNNTENVDIVKPVYTFKEVIDKFGYPVISKRVSRMIKDLQNPCDENKKSRDLYMTGRRADNQKGTPIWTLPKKWKSLVDAPFKVSDYCCAALKKQPMKVYEKKTGFKPYLALMASESNQRETGYLRMGCNSFTGRVISQPMAFWMEEDVWAYLKKFNVPYCNIYDLGYNRTGCVFCMFGVHLEDSPNRFQLMHKTHPQLWNYCLNKLNIKQVLDFIKVPYE